MRYIIIYRGFKLQPYDHTSLKITLLIAAGMILHYILPHAGSPIISIIYRSAFIMSVYAGGIYFFRVVPEFEVMGMKLLKRLQG